MSPDWVLVSNSFGDRGWAVPESGATSELGDFVFSEPMDFSFRPPNGFFASFAEPDGTISDIISVANTAGGNGELKFYSDPTNPTQLIADLVTAGLGPLTTGGIGEELDVFVGGFGGLTLFIKNFDTVDSAFNGDLEVPFDPNGFGFNISDSILFTPRAFGQIIFVNAVPLPAALPLFASGLAGLGWLSRRKRKQAQVA